MVKNGAGIGSLLKWSYLRKDYRALAVPVLWLLQGYYKENLFRSNFNVNTEQPDK